MRLSAPRLVVLVLATAILPAGCMRAIPAGARTVAAPVAAAEENDYDRQEQDKRMTDLSFMTQLSGEMLVRKVTYASDSGFMVPAYLFSPRDTARRHAAIIAVHDGIHGDFSTMYVSTVRDLVARGYVVVAPEYRGSTGYGRAHYQAIDYGGKEVDDALAARDFLHTFVPWADLDRLGVLGWSHGGFITIHAILRRPEWFKAGAAIVPVADLPARMKTHDEDYGQIFARQPAFGGTLAQNPRPYIERSPDAHARELKVPLLHHTASNDDDVFIVEGRALRDSMVSAGKDKAGLYRYHEWQDPPARHYFSRVETLQAKESWSETLAFLAEYLKP